MSVNFSNKNIKYNQGNYKNNIFLNKKDPQIKYKK